MIILSQFLWKIKQRVLTLNKKQKMIAASVILLLLLMLCRSCTQDNAVVMQPADVSNPVQVAEKLNISEPEAKDVVQAIEKAVAKSPVTSWTVLAKNTQEAARVVEKQIENKTAPPMPSADKTVVTPRKTKVDVYRIDMDADWEIGIGYGNHDGQSYIPIEIQRNYAKHKGVAVAVHMDTGMQKINGYEIKHVWRF